MPQSGNLDPVTRQRHFIPPRRHGARPYVAGTGFLSNPLTGFIGRIPTAAPYRKSSPSILPNMGNEKNGFVFLAPSP